MPGFLVHVGATVTVLSRRAGAAHCAEPAGDGERPADGHDCRALCRGGLRVAAAARGERPLRDGAVADGIDARHLQRTAAGCCSDSQAICAPTGTPLLITVTQTRVTAM